MDGRVCTALVQIRAKIRWPILRGHMSFAKIVRTRVLGDYRDETVHTGVYKCPIRHMMYRIFDPGLSVN